MVSIVPLPGQEDKHAPVCAARPHLLHTLGGFKSWSLAKGVPVGGQGYRRVMLKISGEACGGGRGLIDVPVLQEMARRIKELVTAGIQVMVVPGGGNFFRGQELKASGMDRSRADYMGMLGTVMNCLALQDILERAGVETRVQTAITMGQVAEPYVPRRAIRHMEKGRVVIFGAGAGMPYFSTDTTAAQRALELRAEVILMAKNGVDGVYSADPRTDPTATKFDTLTFQEVLERGLKVADATAISLCMENDLPVVVFDFDDPQSLARAARGEAVGTLITTVPRGKDEPVTEPQDQVQAPQPEEEAEESGASPGLGLPNSKVVKELLDPPPGAEKLH